MTCKSLADDVELKLRDQKICQLEIQCKQKDTDMYILKEAYELCLEETEELETLFKNEQDNVNALSTEIIGLRRELKNIKIPLSTNAEKVLRRSLRTLRNKNVGKYKMKLGSEFVF
jgi:uncharacterized protein YlxW (UPF0749 family)